jgi:hypothetical protein
MITLETSAKRSLSKALNRRRALSAFKTTVYVCLSIHLAKAGSRKNPRLLTREAQIKEHLNASLDLVTQFLRAGTLGTATSVEIEKLASVIAQIPRACAEKLRVLCEDASSNFNATAEKLTSLVVNALTEIVDYNNRIQQLLPDDLSDFEVFLGTVLGITFMEQLGQMF